MSDWRINNNLLSNIRSPTAIKVTVPTGVDFSFHHNAVDNFLGEGAAIEIDSQRPSLEYLVELLNSRFHELSDREKGVATQILQGLSTLPEEPVNFGIAARNIVERAKNLGDSIAGGLIASAVFELFRDFSW